MKILIFLLIPLAALTGMLCAINNVYPDSSHNAITQADRDWINNTTQAYEKVGQLTKDIDTAYKFKDYEAVKTYGKALTKVTEKAVEDNFNASLSLEMQPAQKAYESSMMILHDSTWYLTKDGYDLYLEEKSKSIQCYQKYLAYR